MILRAASTRTTAQLYSSKESRDPMVNAMPGMLSASLGKRWRAERNFWLSFLAFFSWMCAFPCCGSPPLGPVLSALLQSSASSCIFYICRVLARLYVVVRRLVILNDENTALKSGPLPEDKVAGLPADDSAPSAPKKTE